MSNLVVHNVTIGHLYVLLTVHPGMILVNNQLDEQFFFMYVYFNSLHGSGSHVPTIRRIIVSIRHLVYITLKKKLKSLKLNIKFRNAQEANQTHRHKDIKTKLYKNNAAI